MVFGSFVCLCCVLFFVGFVVVLFTGLLCLVFRWLV